MAEEHAGDRPVPSETAKVVADPQRARAGRPGDGTARGARGQPAPGLRLLETEARSLDGGLVQDEDRLRTLTGPLPGIFGEDDGGTPLEGVREFEKTLRRPGKDARIEIYPGAEHAFANPSGTRYNAAGAEYAWAKTLTFLDRTLRN